MDRKRTSAALPAYSKVKPVWKGEIDSWHIVVLAGAARATGAAAEAEIRTEEGDTAR